MSKIKSAVDTVINTLSAKLGITIKPPPVKDNGDTVVVLDGNTVDSRSMNMQHANAAATITIYNKSTDPSAAIELLASIEDYAAQSTLEEFVSEEVQIIGFNLDGGIRLADHVGDDWLYQLQMTIRYHY